MKAMERHWQVGDVVRDTSRHNLVANGLNQYGKITSGGVTNAVTYDACGNLTRAGTSTYQYFMGLLIHALAKDAQGVYHSSSFENDAENRRRYKHVPAGFTQPGDHYFTYSDWSLQVEDVCAGPNYWTPSASNYYVWGRDLSGTLDGAGGLSRYGAISRRAAKGAEPQRRGKRRRFFNTKITENTKNTKCKKSLRSLRPLHSLR